MSHHYEQVNVCANYSPWREDAAFLEIYEAIKASTLVDIYRCYELWQLVGQVSKLAAGCLLEVGAWKGGTGALIAKRSQLLGLSAPTFLCDTFTGVPKAGPVDGAVYHGGEHSDTSKAEVEQLLRSVRTANTHVLQGLFPEETGEQLLSIYMPGIRFCHIDVDVYQSAKDVAEWVWPRLVNGGILVYDDYGFSACPGVTRWVNEQRDQPDRITIHNLNGHAVVIKTS